MTAFNVRSRGYQAGLLLLVFSSVLFLIGLIAPMWLVYQREIIQIQEEKWNAGIFIGCKYMLRMVGARSFAHTRCSFGFADAFLYMQDMGNWIHAVEAFEILSAIALIFACIYGATVNCFTTYPGPRTRILELTSGIAGTVAFIFCMVFVGKLRFAVEGSVFYTFEWAFYLTVISSISIVVAALIIALFNEYIPPPADYNFSNATLSKPTPTNVTQYAPSVAYSTHDDDEMYDSRVAQVIDDYEDGPPVGGRRGGRSGRRPRNGGGPGRYESDL